MYPYLPSNCVRPQHITSVYAEARSCRATLVPFLFICSQPIHLLPLPLLLSLLLLHPQPTPSPTPAPTPSAHTLPHPYPLPPIHSFFLKTTPYISPLICSKCFKTAVFASKNRSTQFVVQLSSFPLNFPFEIPPVMHFVQQISVRLWIAAMMPAVVSLSSLTRKEEMGGEGGARWI